MSTAERLNPANQESDVLASVLQGGYDDETGTVDIGAVEESALRTIYETFEAEYGPVVFDQVYLQTVRNKFYRGVGKHSLEQFVGETVRQLCSEFDYEPTPILERVGLAPDTAAAFEPFSPLSSSMRMLPSQYAPEEKLYWQDVYRSHIPDCLRTAIDEYVEAQNEDPSVMYPPKQYDLARVFYCFQVQLLGTLHPDDKNPRGMYNAERNETTLLVKENRFIAYQITGDNEWYVGRKDFDQWSSQYYKPTPLNIGVELSRRAVEAYAGQSVDDAITVLVTYAPPDFWPGLLNWDQLS
jgi:hypothetical protein